MGFMEQLAHFGGASGADGTQAQKVGLAADYERGVILKGPWETWGDGFNEHTRRNARALALAGAPIALRSIAPRIRIAMGEELNIDREYDDLLRKTVSTVAAQVLQLVPHEGALAPFVNHRYYSVEQQAAINSRLVVYAVWERMAGLRADDRDALNKAGKIWVAANATKAFLVSEGVSEDKILVFGCPYLPGEPLLKLRGRERAKGRPRFYHIGKWEPRKDQHRMLGAFMCAFKPGEASLLLKTSDKAPFYTDYPHSVQASVTGWLEDSRVKANGWTADNMGRDVLVALRRLSEDGIRSMHRIADCYVSLSRGEGFDMPAFDAKLAGNLMLYTPSGGPQDYAHANDVLVPSSGLVPANPWYNWCEGAQYLDWELDAAIEGFRTAAARIVEGVDRTPDLSAFSAEEMGARMLASLNDLGELNLTPTGGR